MPMMQDYLGMVEEGEARVAEGHVPVVNGA